MSLEEAKRRIKEAKEKGGTQLKLDNLGLEKISDKLEELIIQELPNLMWLYLQANKLKKIPDFIIEGKLKKLEVLSISDNLFDELSLDFVLNFPDIEFYGNPYKNMPWLSELLDSTEFDIDALKLWLKLKKQNFLFQDNKNYTTLKIPKELQTPITQYLLFFKDFVERAKKKKVNFELKREETGIVLITNGDNEVGLEEMKNYFEEYVELTREKMAEWEKDLHFGPWKITVDKDLTPQEYENLVLRFESQVMHLQQNYKIARAENTQLKSEDEFLRQLASDFSKQTTHVHVYPESSENVDLDKLLEDLIDKAIRMMERKDTQKLEDLHNDDLTDWLRDKGYKAFDQTRSGKAKMNAGEIDIMIRKENGTPVSILEAFRLSSCGSENNVVAEHIDKLLHDYDTVGHKRNFIIVYAEAKSFQNLWEKYVHYVDNIENKAAFRNDYPLIRFRDKSATSGKTDLKVGLAIHEREGEDIEIYHIFMNMYTQAK